MRNSKSGPIGLKLVCSSACVQTKLFHLEVQVIAVRPELHDDTYWPDTDEHVGFGSDVNQVWQYHL